MEFDEVVRRRRMVRRYDPARPVAGADVEALLALARRAPSAGHSQGWQFLVLSDEAGRAAFWSATSSNTGPADSWLAGLRTAPVLIVAFSERAAYQRRYTEDDKAVPDKAVPDKAVPDKAVPDKAVPDKAVPDSDLDQRWPVPYWHVDTGMAVLTILLGAVDRGLAACLFAVPTNRVDALAAAFDVPAGLVPVGVISLGYRAPDERPHGSGQRRARRPAEETVHYGRFRDSNIGGDPVR